MNDEYYQAVNKMQALGVRKDYMLGWIGGYMGNPKLEEQRMTDGYEAGYEDGENKETSNFDAWLSDN